jgi:hypothetical protein
MQVALCRNIQVDQPMPGDLVEHVVKERHAGSELPLAAAVEIETHGDPGLQGITDDFSLTHDFRPQRRWDGEP